MQSAAEKAREKFLAGMTKSYGEGTASVKDKNVYDVIPTGSIALDRAMATGGYVRGRLTELWGPPKGGKSSLTYVAIGNAHRIDPLDAIFVDVEHTYDPSYARSLGADPSRIIHIDPLTAENVADQVKDSIGSGIASMVVIDSIGAVLTQNEFDKAAGESDMGKRAQVVSRMINIACGLAPRHNVAVLVINQARANFGYGADTKPSGGFVPAHSMTHRLNVKRASTPYQISIGDEKMDVGYEMGIKIERNKVGPGEGRNVKVDFYTFENDRKGVHYPVGIDRVQEAFVLGVRDGFIEQRGSFYTIDGQKFQGEASALDALRERPKLIDELRTKILADVKGEVRMTTLPELTKEQVDAL